MTRRRFYTPRLDDDRLTLDAEQAAHARKSLRLSTGDTVELFDGRGTVAVGRIEQGVEDGAPEGSRLVGVEDDGKSRLGGRRITTKRIELRRSTLEQSPCPASDLKRDACRGVRRDRRAQERHAPVVAEGRTEPLDPTGDLRIGQHARATQPPRPGGAYIIPAEFLEQVMFRVTLAGATFLVVIAVLPQILSQSVPNMPPVMAMFLGGTSILIVVGVALDLVDKINSHLLMRAYEGFMPPMAFMGEFARRYG